ncbi:MAG: cardiolipin synthase [Lachnospirales bacterium]
MKQKNSSNIDFQLIFKLVAVALTLIFQLTILVSIILLFEKSAIVIELFSLLNIIFAAYIIYKPQKTSYKLSWLFVIFALPIAGLLLFLFFSKQRFGKSLRKIIIERRTKTSELFKPYYDTVNEIEDADVRSQAYVIQTIGRYPTYKNTEVKYFPVGEKYFDALKKELKKSEKFIFLEYFIISDGIMFNELMEILKEKANAGVDVRFIYDAAGSAVLLPKSFKSECKNNNIKLHPFNPIHKNLYFYVSYRNHRKITVIDGNVGFTGGINIGDEYINKNDRLGHWKDMGLMLKGEAVFSLTAMFLDGWKIVTGNDDEYLKYKPTIKIDAPSTFVAPFDDAPLDNETPAEHNYMRMIANAKKYIYITTPYLIIDSEISSLLNLAAKSGVDVRILTPHIPDKKAVFQVTRSHYLDLIHNGVKIYEYTPGFVHGKMLITDDKVAFVGSINFDYRSLTWNYECGAWVYDKVFVKDTYDDFMNTLEASMEITIEICEKYPLHMKLLQSFLKIAGPLL